MTTTTERSPSRTGVPLVLLVVREQDACRGSWLQTQLEDVLRVRPDRVVVDLSECSALDSGGLRALLQAHVELARRGAQLTLRGLSPRLVRVVRLCGLTDVFAVQPAVTA